jgi:hypothetical protein
VAILYLEIVKPMGGETVKYVVLYYTGTSLACDRNLHDTLDSAKDAVEDLRSQGYEHTLILTLEAHKICWNIKE